MRCGKTRLPSSVEVIVNGCFEDFALAVPPSSPPPHPAVQAAAAATAARRRPGLRTADWVAFMAPTISLACCSD
jgi:hypothetical protein